jgi:hypothetical protein
MTVVSRWGLIVVPLLLLLMAVPAFAVTPSSVATFNPKGGTKGLMGTSPNWSGYLIAAQNGSVTDVRGTWVVPAIRGACPTTYGTSSSFWVGMDGVSSSTVEQTGTISACVKGVPSYSAWFEYYPNPLVTIFSVPVKPGDLMSAEVSYSGVLKLSISDLTGGRTFSISLPGIVAARSSAEWVAEDPANVQGTLSFANFGVVNFGGGSSAAGSADSATVAGISGPIGAFGSAVVQVQMISSSGAVKASPSVLSASGSGFSVTWVSAGP